MNETTRICPICQGDQRTPLFENRMPPLDGLDMSYRIARCCTCGFTYADQLPTPDSYAGYYRVLSKYDLSPQMATVSAADQARFNMAVALLRPHVGPEASIADLGCATGALLHALQSAGWSRLAGLDPAPSAPAQAKKLFGLDCVRHGSLHEASSLLKLNETDVVCLTGVLEHLSSLREDLKSLVDALHPQSKILIEVPTAERFSRPPLEPYGEFSLEHIQYFTTNTLCRLFNSLGFSAVSVSILDLPAGYCDSLFGLFSRAPEAPPPQAADASTYLESYIDTSEALMREVLDRIAACPAREIAIYGAGSHTARLLPRLMDAGIAERIVTIVDNNPNLQGKTLGTFRIEPPETLERFPSATFLISSFRSQSSIDSMLRQHYTNPVLTLY